MNPWLTGYPFKNPLPNELQDLFSDTLAPDLLKLVSFFLYSRERWRQLYLKDKAAKMIILQNTKPSSNVKQACVKLVALPGDDGTK